MKNIINKIFNRLKILSVDKYSLNLFKYLNPNKSIILVDVGAHNGAFTDLILNYCGIKKGVLIEPLNNNFEYILKKYINKNDWIFLKNVVGDKENAEVNFFINSFSETSSLLKIKNIKELEDVDIEQKEEVILKMKTLNNIYLENNIKEVDLIKIDVQGAEHLVLAGGVNALKKTKMVWIENSFKSLYEGSSLFNDIYKYMNELDFYLAEISPGHRSNKGELLQVDTLYINNKYKK